MVMQLPHKKSFKIYSKHVHDFLVDIHLTQIGGREREREREHHLKGIGYASPTVLPLLV